MSSYILVELNDQAELVVRCENCNDDQASLANDILNFTKGVLGL